MKSCGSCGKEYQGSYSRCPHCSSEISFRSLTKDDALSVLDSMQLEAKSGALVNRGVEFVLQGRYSEAEAAYKQAIEIYLQNATAHGNMGHVLLKQGKIEEAIPWLEKALELDPMLEGLPQALTEARQAIEKKKASLTEEDMHQLQKESASVRKSFWERLFGRKGPQARVRFLRKYERTVTTVLGQNVCTYERYQAGAVSDALTFLETRAIKCNFYYVEVETPEGLVGKDVKGVYKM